MKRLYVIMLAAVLIGLPAVARCASAADAAAVAKARDAVVVESAVLQSMIDEAQKAGKDTAYPRAALAVAKRFLRIDPLKPKENGDEISVDMDRCLGIMDNAIADMKAGKELKVPTPSMKGLTLNGPNFYSGKDPVMLIGPVGTVGNVMWLDLDEVVNLGFNVMDDETAGWAGQFLSVMKPPISGSEDPVFNQAAAHAILGNWDMLEAKNINMALILNPGIDYVPDWVYQLYPETKPDSTWKSGWFKAPLESPNMRKLWAKYYEGIISVTKDDPRLLLYWLEEEPMYWSHTPMYLDMFRTYLREKYKSVDALNAVWGMDFKAFDEVGWPQKDDLAAWYDWNDFHYGHVTEFFAWQRSQVKKVMPNAITSGKPMSWNIDSTSIPNDEIAVDLEAMADIYEVPGFDSYWHSTADITNWFAVGGDMLLDFWKSVAPNKPFANLEHNANDETPGLEYSHSADDAARFMEVTYWQQFLHGLRLCTFWLWIDSEPIAGSGPQAYCPLTMQPTALYATSKAALDLRRLARYVALFPASSETAIYFSKPSLFMDPSDQASPDADNRVSELRSVYGGLDFLDAPVGFITDKMILKGIDKRIKFLVIPNMRYVSDDVYRALENYARNGGRMYITGDSSLSRDEKNHERDTQNLRNLPNVSWIDSGKDMQWFWGTFDKILDTSGIARPVRVTDDTGNPVWLVESRTVESGGKRFTYLINMSKEDKKVHLKATDKIGEIRDLIADESDKENTFVLKPFEVKFLELQ